MEVEKSLNMSLDDIINQQKKSRPIGEKTAKSPQGRQSVGRKNAPLVRPRQAGTGAPRRQASQNGKKTSKQPLAPKRTAMHNISKRQPQSRPANQPRGNQARTAGKSRQQNAPKFMPNAGNQPAPQRNAPKAFNNPPTLRVTIDNPRAQRPAPIHQQARPQVVMPGRQFVVSNPAARQSSTVVRVQSPQYAPAAQPMEIVEAEGNYPVAASRKSYAPAASRPVNAASFLRDPYRGDDFERTSSQGMRSDARYGSQARGKPGGYGDLMDDPARDDRYQPRVSGAVYAKPSSRSQHVY